MTMRMLIDARHPEETRVAVVNGNRVEEFDFEAAAKKQIKGNIYLAKVTRVEPSLQAAFIEYGGNRHGFLAFSEIHPDYYQIPREDRDALLREEEALDREEVEAAQADEYDEEIDEDPGLERPEAGESGELAPPPVPANEHHDDVQAERMRERRMALRRRYKIQEVIKRRQVLLVQVVKEERGNKGAALTTYLSLAGRYCVLMPNTSHGGGISRKISSIADRRRLKSIMDELRLPGGMACIVRTAGLSRTKTEIKRDFDYLTRLWDDIRELTLRSTAPALIHEDSDLLKRAIRDIYTREIEEVLVEGGEGYAQARNFMKLLMPSHAKRVRHYVDPIPLFQRAQVETQLNAMFHPVVQLRSGGYLVINPTEALVSIDINSGRSTREHNIEETAVKTNLEAAEEIARQLRLRDLAGLVVIDFIDMEHHSNVRKVERQLKEALKQDRARIQVGRISSFGLLEMSRQRLRTGVLESSSHTCPMCEGAGVVRSVPSAALAAIRGLEEEAVRGRASLLTLRAAMAVAVYILNRKRQQVVDLEERYGVRIEVAPDETLISPHYAIETAGGPPVRAPLAPARAALPAADEEEEDEGEEIEEYEAEEDEEEEIEAAPRSRAPQERDEGEPRRGRRRRRRRGGRGRADERTPADDRAPAEERRVAATAEEPDDREDAAEAVREAGEDAGDERRGRRRRGRRGGRGRAGGALPMEAGDSLDIAEAEDAPAPEALPEPEALPAPAPVLAEAAEPLVPEAEPAKPRRSRRKAAEAPAVEAPAAEAPVAQAPAEPAPAAEEAKPKRSRRKKADEPAAERAPAEAVPAEASVADAAPAAEEAKPKRSRRKKADEPAAGPAPVELNGEPVAAAPVDAAAPVEAEAEAAGPPRRGWWQRTFGN